MGGRLIVFEGVEGAGKTTQLARLERRLARAGLPVRTYREPGGTPAGNRIRDVLLDPSAALDPRAEALLFMASRAELVATALRPALASGVTVLLDRFFLSTYAYQIGGRGLPEADVVAANRVATGGLVPDLTLLLVLPAQAGMARASGRGPTDRMERLGAAFHQRVEDAFARFAMPDWQAAHPEAGLVVRVDGQGPADDVERRIAEAVATHLPDLAAPLDLVVA